MIISNSRKFIFVHLHKTAGTTITKQLDHTLKWNDLVLGSTVLGEKIQNAYYNRFALHKHSKAKEIRAIIGERLWSIYYTFTFVRHPYARAVSLYLYIKKMIDSKGIRRYLPIRRFRKEPFWRYPVSKAYLETKSFSEFIRHENMKRAIGMKPQTEWILDDNGEIIVDFIGKLENLNTDYKILANKIGVQSAPLGVYNQSNKGRKNDYLCSKDDREYLYHLFRSDFDLLGYDRNN